MAVNTILLDFTVPSSRITNPEGSRVIQDEMESVLSKYVPGLKRLQVLSVDGSFVTLLLGDRGTIVTIRGFKEGLVTCNIEYYKNEDEKPLLLFEQIRSLESHLKDKLCSSRSKIFPPIKRGAFLDVYLTTSDSAKRKSFQLPLLVTVCSTVQLQSVRKLEKEIARSLKTERSHSIPALKRGDKINTYFPTADERILEYDIDKILYEEKSPYQKILIVHSKSLGNLLVLDDLQNMSESDLIYTETLMQRGKENYENKEIVILGGGDGALLWELLKEKPKFVYMLEIDELVMKACSKHLRSCCGDCLDKLKGDNYEIIIEDCVKILEKFIAEGRKFDYVFGDLTDIPLSSTPQGEVWDFIRFILNSSLAVLKPEGKYMTHGNGASCPESLKMFEDQLQHLSVPVEFSRDHAFVPSFMEDWIFYQVWKKQN